MLYGADYMFMLVPYFFQLLRLVIKKGKVNFVYVIFVLFLSYFIWFCDFDRLKERYIFGSTQV